MKVIAAAMDQGGQATKVDEVHVDGKTRTVKDSAGNDFFRSAVYRDPKTGTYLFSDEAMNAGMFDKKNLAINWKRFLGDPTKHFFDGTASAKDVATIFSKHLKECVSASAGQAVDDCCITFPQNFPDNAKRDLIEAVELAGWKIIPAGRGGMGQLTEPVAAALAYADEHSLSSTGAKVLVVDVGSTTTDVCYVLFQSGEAIVLGAHGEHKLGAQDIQQALFELVIIAARKTGILKNSDLAKLKTVEGLEPELQRSVEGAMKALSNRADTRIPISFGSKPGFVTITRDQFETEVLEPFVKKVLDCMDKAKEPGRPRRCVRPESISRTNTLPATGGSLSRTMATAWT
jgi:molecular chaperone DnaK (HSP70)